MTMMKFGKPPTLQQARRLRTQRLRSRSVAANWAYHPSLLRVSRWVGKDRASKHQDSAVPISDALSYVQAATLPTVFLPSWSIIMREGKLQPHETAMVLSSSSGVGTAAIQIIKGVVGATCIAVTSSEQKIKKSIELGADHTINYKTEKLAERVKEITGGKGVDMVVDSSGALFFEDAYASLARGGRFGTCGVTSGYQSQIHLGQLFSKELRVFGVFMGSTDELRQIVDAAGKGQIKGAIHRTLPLRDVATAHEEMERSEHFGKFVVTVD